MLSSIQPGRLWESNPGDKTAARLKDQRQYGGSIQCAMDRDILRIISRHYFMDKGGVTAALPLTFKESRTETGGFSRLVGLVILLFRFGCPDLNVC